MKEALEIFSLIKMGMTLKNITGYDELDEDLRYKLHFIDHEITKNEKGGFV